MSARQISRISLLIASVTSLAAVRASPPLDPKFFAQTRLQRQTPAAFVLQPEAAEFLRAVTEFSSRDQSRFAEAIRERPELLASIQRFDRLAIPEQQRVLREVFDVEVRTLGIVPPQLVLSDAAPKAAFFDFDPARGGTGTVILNLKKLRADRHGYSPLLLLIHETRHSAQVQLAFAHTAASKTPLASGFRVAFNAQGSLKGLSFCDFGTLNNEYEALQFANQTVGTLTDWKVRPADLGTLASQYDERGRLRINLRELRELRGEHGSLVDEFNALEQEQYTAKTRSQG